MKKTPNTPELLPLIYIVGMGRSGSTLLDMLLGSHKQIANTGEFTNFAKWLAEDEYCTCKNKIRLCPLWSKVLSNVPTDASKHPLTPPNKGKLLSLKQIIMTMFGQKLKQSELEVAYRNRELWQALLEATEASWIVDSSKSFNRLCFLEKSRLFELKVIHLVRDGRGVANSKKSRKQPIRQMWNLDAKGPKPVAWTTGYWVLVNLICQILRIACFKENSILVRYEDLCLNPNREMTRIMDFIGLSSNQDYGRIPSGTYHNIAGNHARYNEDKRISLDQKWINGLTIRDKFIFALMGGWMNLILGFGMFRRIKID